MPNNPWTASGETRARSLRVAVFGALTLFIASALVVSGYTLWRLRSEAIATTFEIAAMHSRSFEDHLTQSLRLVELTLSSALPADVEVTQAQIVKTLAGTLRHTPILRSFSLIDARGIITASSNPANIGLTVSTESYLPIAPPGAEILRVGVPWSGRDFARGRPASAYEPVPAKGINFLPLTRTLPTGAGTVTVLATLNPDYFINSFEQKLSPSEGYVDVVRYDGTLLLSSDPREQPAAIDTRIATALRQGEKEVGQLEALHHNRTELNAFRASRLYPIAVVTRLDREHALLRWDAELRTLLSVLVPVLLSIVALAYAIYRRQLQLVAQRAEAGRLMRLNSTVFESSSDSIIITDATARIISVNAGFTRICGYPPEEVIGKNPRLLSSGLHGRGFYDAMWQEILAHGSWTGEIINRAKDGKLFTSLNTITAFRDTAGNLQHYIGISSDITARKYHEAHIAELNRSLAQRAHEAEAASHSKDIFLANMSHELRTPLNAIMGLTDLVLRRTTDAKQKDQLGKVIQSSRKLLAIINDILDISRIGSNTLQLEKSVFCLDDVLQNLLNLVNQQAARKNLLLTIDVPAPLHQQPFIGDPVRLGQIFLHLTENAIKFTDQGTITVRLQQVSEQTRDVLLRAEIQDTGIGISSEDQGRLFTAFEQADGSLTRKYGGTGLGLAISKRLAEMMGGEMGVHSAVGVGSTFWVSFRLEKLVKTHAPDATAHKAPPQPNDGTRRRPESG